MEPERNETYERIPWETLEEKKPDRQWMMMAVAGAVVLGALAYSFMSNRPAPIPVASTLAAAVPETTRVASPVPQAAAQPVATTAPVVTAEADLYAVHPERVIDRAVAHAEWFVAEYLTMDGTEEGRAALTALLPAGVPMPAAADGTRVFVEWVTGIGRRGGRTTRLPGNRSRPFTSGRFQRGVPASGAAAGRG